MDTYDIPNVTIATEATDLLTARTFSEDTERTLTTAGVDVDVHLQQLEPFEQW